MIVNIKNIEITKDKYSQLLNLYRNFSNMDANILTFKKFKKIITNLKDNHLIFIYITNNIIIGSITLLIEQKLIHNGKNVGHIEDFVIDINNRNCGIGKLLLNHAINISKQNNCYKCILDCDVNLENYYKKTGFIKKGIYMGNYF